MRGQNKVILLVEDEVINAMAIARELENSGYNVISVHSGEEAVELVSAESEIDMVLMDVNLSGGIGGDEAAKRILEKHSLPLLFLSNHTHPEVVEKTNNIGSYGYIVKDTGITVIDTSIKMAFKLFEEKRLVEAHKEKLEKAYRELQEKNEELCVRDKKIKQAESDLIKSDEKLCCLQDFYRNILDSILTGVWAADEDDIVTYINKQIRDTHGLTRYILPGKKIFSDFPPAYLDMFKDFFIKAKQTLEPVYYENIKLVTGDNQEYVQSGYLLPQVKKGLYSGMICTIEDTTERVAAEEMLKDSEKLFRLIFENANAGICFLDTQGRYILINEYLASLLGGKPHDVIGKSLFEVFPEGSGLDKKGFDEIISSKKESTFDTALDLNDGRKLWFSSNIKPVFGQSGTLLGIQIILIDITKRKSLEQALNPPTESEKS